MIATSTMTRLGRAMVCAILGFGLAGCRADESEPPPPVRPVLFETVRPRTSEIFGPFAGTIAPRYQSDLGFQIAGRIVARDVSVGDVVTRRQRLAALDPTVTQFAVTQAIADLNNAQAQRANAEATASRQQTLFSSGAVSQSQLDSADASRDTALARVSQAEAALQKAQDQTGYTELDADYAGVVTTWTAEVGQVVSAGQSVVTVARPDVKEAVVDIPDALIGGVKPDQTFDVRLQSASDVATSGRVREIAPQSDAATRTRRIRLSLADPPVALRLGTTIAVSTSRPIPPQIDIPATALLERDGSGFVWIVAPDGASVHSRKVEIAGRTPATISIAAGLAAGDKIVVAGVHSLTDNQSVRPEKPL